MLGTLLVVVALIAAIGLYFAFREYAPTRGPTCNDVPVGCPSATPAAVSHHRSTTFADAPPTPSSTLTDPIGSGS